MRTATLFTAFAMAQTRNPDSPSVVSRLDPWPGDDTVFLKALRNSATDRDQIIQRRIGMIASAPTRP